MKVLALGVGRTGTACKLVSHPEELKLLRAFSDLSTFFIQALRAALQRLGYVKTYHMMSASVENPPDCLMWHDALNAKYDGVGEFGRKEWDQLLGDCQV